MTIEEIRFSEIRPDGTMTITIVPEKWYDISIKGEHAGWVSGSALVRYQRGELDNDGLRALAQTVPPAGYREGATR